MAVVFVKGGTSHTVRNPVRSNILRTRKFQVQGRTAGGIFFAYDKGIDIKEIEIEFTDLQEQEKLDLQSFFENDADGMRNTWTYTDHHNASWTARFLEPQLDFVEDDNRQDSRSDGSYITAGESFPSAKWTKGIWSVRMKLEVS